jgi:hypothetical protein
MEEQQKQTTAAWNKLREGTLLDSTNPILF